MARATVNALAVKQPHQEDMTQKIFGGDVVRVPPDPIPNSEVKPHRADGTAREIWWESRTPPKFITNRAIAERQVARFSFCLDFGSCALRD